MAAADTWRAPSGVIRSQIVENCSFFSPPGSQLSVILTHEPLGTYKAIILRTEPGGPREVLLSSESGLTLHRTLELLLIKSADAVQNYISANGYEVAPSAKRVEDVVAGDDDDGASSASSASEVLDDDPDRGLGDSALSLSEVESAYESVSEDGGGDGRFPRARGARALFPMRVRRARSPMLDDPSLAPEGRQHRGALPHCLPPHTGFPGDHPRRAPRYDWPREAEDLDGPVNLHSHAPGCGIGCRAPPPPAAPHPTRAGGAWQHGAMGQAPPDDSTSHIRFVDNMGPPPSRFFSHHPPPPPGTKVGIPPPPPPPVAAMAAAQRNQQQNPHAKPPVSNGVDRNSVGPPPMSMGMPPMGMGMGMGGMGMGGMGMGGMTMPSMMGMPSARAATYLAPLGPAAPPTPSTTSSSSSASSSPSSTPTLAPSPNSNNSSNKPPAPAAPAPIDYRICIRSCGPHNGTQAGQNQDPQKGPWHEKRIVVRSPPTLKDVRTAAANFCERHRDLFVHLYGYNNSNSNSSNSGATPSSSDGGSNKRRHHHQRQHQDLLVNVTSVAINVNERYDLSSYAGNDLSRLCAGGSGGMPLFEVTVENPFFTLS